MNAQTNTRRRIGLIGFGAIGQPVVAALRRGDVANASLSAVLVRDAINYHEVAAAVIADPLVTFTDDPDAFFAADVDLVVEAAGQVAVRQYAARALKGAADLVVVSIGAFADEVFFTDLTELAVEQGRRLFLAAGALPAVDWMQAAAQAPVDFVTITQIKPVDAWRGTPAEELTNLDVLREPTSFFQGPAREAAATFVKSSNITAMLALATMGMAATQVCLVADPTTDRMRTQIAFEGEAGGLRVEWEGTPSHLNPSTSADVPLAVIKAIRHITANVVLGT